MMIKYTVYFDWCSSTLCGWVA